MTPPKEWHLETALLIGRRVLAYSSIPSTNSMALGYADDESNDGLAILARQQTAGRGQHGRTWTAPPDSSVLLSVLVFPPPSLRRPALLTAWAADAVCETIREVTGRGATIKWPNDVLVGGRKICGILLEKRKGVVAGIGLNVHQTRDDFLAAGLPDATSLALSHRGKYDTKHIAEILLLYLDGIFWELCKGEVEGLQDRWTERLGLLGETVAAECVDGMLHGRVHELSFDGVTLH